MEDLFIAWCISMTHKSDEEIIKEIDNAWNNPGPVPSYHYAMQNKLRREWPTLANALDKLSK